MFRRCGFEVKFNEAPEVTRSMRDVVRVLSLDQFFVVCPGRDAYPVDSRISVLPLPDVIDLLPRIDALQKCSSRAHEPHGAGRQGRP